MLRSMTGYGKHDVSSEGGRIIVEIRTVNHRYGELFVKIPRPLMDYEIELRKRVTARVKRGKIELSVQREDMMGAEAAPVVNMELAKRYLVAFTAVQQAFGLSDEPTLSLIASQKDVVQVRAEVLADDQVGEKLLAAVDGALDALDSMRLREGEALEEDLRGRRQTLDVLLGRVEQRVPEVVKGYANRMRDRLAQLMADVTLDPARMAQEVAIMADRSDISEEIVRFHSHIQQFDETLKMGEPVGRKLDFIMQEMNREVNTIGSKANDAEMAGLVVELKAELEKIREQIQNVE